MKPKVAIVRCTSYNRDEVNRGIRELIGLLGGINNFISPGQSVFIKPNLLMKKKPEEVVTTHPEIIGAMAKLVQEAGGKVLVGDSPGGPYNVKVLQGVYKVCGLEDMAAETGVELNLNCEEVKVDHPAGKVKQTLNVIKPALQADVVINLPKLKTHGLTVLSGAVKNLFGLIPGLKKAEYHFNMLKLEDFVDALLDINTFLQPGLVVMDAVVGMEGPAGPSAGTPREVGVLIGGTSTFAVDLVAAALVGISHRKVPTITQAINRGLSPSDLNEIELLGWLPEKWPLVSYSAPPGPVSSDLLAAVPGGKVTGIIVKFIINRLRSKPVFVHSRCTGCRDCFQNCPPKAIKMVEGRPKVELEQCIRCYCCQELCPQKAVEIKHPWLGRMMFK